VYLKLFQWYNDLVFHWSSTDLIRNEPEETDSGVEEAILGLQDMQLDNDSEDNDANDDGFFEAPWIPEPVELPTHHPTEGIPASAINNDIQAPANPPLPVEAHNLPTASGTNSNEIEPVENSKKAAAKARARGKQPAVVDASALAPKTRKKTRNKAT
jgi:hypothetical protein